jgi:Xaa-Pro aminopeptidase
MASGMATDGSRALSPETLPALQAALAEAGLDGWLLYDFRGTNPIASGVLGLQGGFVTRRVFGYIPREGTPVAVTHAIEQGPWRDWPAAWRREIYSSWRTLEATLASIVGGRRVAMEYSPGDAVPYVDRVPAGVLDMVRAAGATVVSSAELVTRFYAVWGSAEIASHRRAAEVIAAIAHEAFVHAGSCASGTSTTEYALQQWILERFERAGLVPEHGPIVAIGPNAANPHYEPTAGGSASIARGDVLLIDLFARERQGVFADQTWMGVLGAPDARTITVWETVRTARDAAIALLQSGRVLRGGEVDDAARAVIVAAGYGEYFTHRTGHSIDAHDLHGAGPHLDNLESRDDRVLLPGVAFSIEPGVYLPGVLGVRSEVNAVITSPDTLLITPGSPQRELIIA